jgi:hypothetical protein
MERPIEFGEQSCPDQAALSDPRRELLERVISSPAFGRSLRLRQFLQFVCEQALKHPEGEVQEREIGKVVFGRSDYDPTHDTLVRAHASQLRKKLQHYFSAEGAEEEMVIEISKGSYKPVFRQRASVLHDEPPDSLSIRPLWKIGSRRFIILLALLGGALMLRYIWLEVENWQLRRQANLGRESSPSVDLLWKQIFDNGRQTYIVLADSNLTLFQDLVHFQMPLVEYQRQQFGPLVQSRLKDSNLQDVAYKLKNRQYTSIADAILAHRVGVLNAAHRIPTEVILARSANPNHFKAHNVIISGPRRANPWLELFESRLNFRSRFEEDPRRSYLENTAPLAGEQPRYEASWDQQGYCRVAYLPNLDSTGSALIISGTDMASSGAGIDFITNEQSVRQLRSALKVPDGEPIPHFEVLLRTQLLIGAASNFEMIAHRLVQVKF